MAIIDLRKKKQEQEAQQMMMLQEMLGKNRQSFADDEITQAIGQTETPEDEAPLPEERPQPEEVPAMEVPPELPEDQELQFSDEGGQATRMNPAKIKQGKGAYDPSAFVKGLVSRGFTLPEAAAIAGNVHVESNFYPGIKSSVPGENSFGFMQWNGARLKGLKNYAEQIGKDWTDPEAQMDWILLERTGDSAKFGGTNEKGAYHKAFSEGGSPGDLAVRVGKYVERPLDINATAQIRAGVANRLIGT